MLRPVCLILIVLMTGCASPPPRKSSPAPPVEAPTPATSTPVQKPMPPAPEPSVQADTPIPATAQPVPVDAPKAVEPVASPGQPAKPAPPPAAEPAPAPAKPEVPRTPAPAEVSNPAPAKPAPASEPVPAPKAVVTTPAGESAPAVNAGGAISGALRITERGKPTAADEFSQAVIYFIPDGAKPAPRAAERREIGTSNKRFDPDLMVVPVGSTLRFPNQDPILHNVFSVSASNPFDLGLYGEGDSKSVTLKNPGIVLVNCNVHHAMQANVLVMDTPYFTRAGAGGGFTLAGIPPGSGKLYVWHARSDVSANPIRVPLTSPLVIDVELTKPKLLPHMNKVGKPYRPTRED